MFRFRLQNVLDFREQQERALASQLAHAETLERHAQARLDGLQATRVASAEQAAGPRSVGELANMAFVLEQLDDHIASAQETVVAANETVSQVKGALTVAFQDRRVLDRLRDRHAETHRASEDSHDRRMMDEIAITRYTHNESL